MILQNLLVLTTVLGAIHNCSQFSSVGGAPFYNGRGNTGYDDDDDADRPEQEPLLLFLYSLTHSCPSLCSQKQVSLKETIHHHVRSTELKGSFLQRQLATKN